MKYFLNTVLSLSLITFAFAIDNNKNQKKAGEENSFKSYSKKKIDIPAQVNSQKEINNVKHFKNDNHFRPQLETNLYSPPRVAELDELDNPEIVDPVRSADYISTSDKLRNGTISIENLFSDLIPN